MAHTPCVLAYSSAWTILSAEAAAPKELTAAGWTFMITSIVGVLGFVIWSYSRLLRSSEPAAVRGGDAPFPDRESEGRP